MQVDVLSVTITLTKDLTDFVLGVDILVINFKEAVSASLLISELHHVVERDARGTPLVHQVWCHLTFLPAIFQRE